ncbi:hypothetical protein TSUD_288460 [Trifolium subterraneum]|uniref:Transposase (putative) gypsy type domain-containing protein n=1 Tax=Trifolium subterraneum TaxID=3900 RepID=A0A2Z6NDQ2_TRISU|nr:hypothetical protein TSUD_288460 [Trifolium subterraneum]
MSGIYILSSVGSDKGRLGCLFGSFGGPEEVAGGYKIIPTSTKCTSPKDCLDEVLAPNRFIAESTRRRCTAVVVAFRPSKPGGGCVPADTPMLKSVENAGETCAVQRSSGPGPCALGLARRPKSGCPQRVGHLGPVQNRSPQVVMLGHEDDEFSWSQLWVRRDLRTADATWMDRPFRFLLPRVKAIQMSLKSLFVGVMAEEQAPASTSNVDGDDKFQWGSFPMYQIAFEHMGYRLPFSDFEVAVFRYLHLTPSQLHPNSLAFIRAFEMTAAYLGFLPTIPLFFHAFHLQRSKPKGNAANKFGWVSLKQSVKLFEMFLESVRGFKDSYFFIKPLNSISWQSIIYRGPAKDATGAPLIGPDGCPILEDYSRFPLSWRKSHYLKPASDFIYSAEELTVEELSNYEQMKVFVGSFPRKSYEDEEGNPVLDESGVPLTKKSFIDTRRLLACKSAAEMEACFREMSSIAAKLRKSKAAKEKRQAAVLGSSSVAALSPGGSDMDNARGGTVVVDLDDTVANTNADNQPRPSKVARVGEGDASATGLTPPSSSKFMLPPAIGSPDLIKKSSVSISDAEKAIMDDMGPEALKNELTDAMVSAFKLMEISSYLNGRECKYLAERYSAKEEAALLRQSLEQAKVGDLVAEKETLEGKVKALESRSGSSSVAPDSDELVVDPNGEYRGFTRAALVSRIFELEAQQLDAAKSSFDNAVAQLMVLNPSVDLVVEALSIPSRAGCSAGHVLSNDEARMKYSPVERGRASPRWDLQPSLKSMSNYAIFHYSIVLASQRSTCEEFLCHRDLQGGMLRFLFLLGLDMVLSN